MAGKPEDRIEHDPFASRRQPQQGERPQEERGSARQVPRREQRGTAEPRPTAPQRPSRDPADGLMQGGD